MLGYTYNVLSHFLVNNGSFRASTAVPKTGPTRVGTSYVELRRVLTVHPSSRTLALPPCAVLLVAWNLPDNENHQQDTEQRPGHIRLQEGMVCW